MPDLAFSVTGIRESLRYRAARHAVLYPLLRNDLTGQKSVIAGMTTLRKMWHTRLDYLQTAKWYPLWHMDDDLEPYKRNNLSRQYMRNCPPFGVYTNDESRSCRFCQICPFCWAREYVLKGFFRLENALYGSCEPGAKPEPGYYLVETHLLRPARPKVGAFDPGFIYEAFHKYSPYYLDRGAERNRDIVAFKASAGIVMQRFVLEKKRGMFWRSTLLLTKHKPNCLPVRELGDREQNYWGFVVKEPNKSAMVTSCRRVFAYPRSMMFGDVDLVVAYLHSTKRRHFYSAYGATNLKTTIEKETKSER